MTDRPMTRLRRAYARSTPSSQWPLWALCLWLVFDRYGAGGLQNVVAGVVTIVIVQVAARMLLQWWTAKQDMQAAEQWTAKAAKAFGEGLGESLQQDAPGKALTAIKDWARGIDADEKPAHRTPDEEEKPL